MNATEINIKIAEACGWTKLHKRNSKFRASPTGTTICGYHKDHEGTAMVDGWCNAAKVPNYYGSLDCCHEMEKLLLIGYEDDPSGSELWSDYQTNLILACPAYLSYHATAPQRCEAFWKTMHLGPWVVN